MKQRLNSLIVHRWETKDGDVYYECNHAVGPLNPTQLMQKTTFGNKKLTCERCLRNKGKRIKHD